MVIGDDDGLAMAIRDWMASDRLAMADDRVGADSNTLDGDIVFKQHCISRQTVLRFFFEMLSKDDVAVQSVAVAAHSIIRHCQPIRSHPIPNSHRQCIIITNDSFIGNAESPGLL